MPLSFLRQRRAQNATTKRDEYVRLIQRTAELGDALPADDQRLLCEIAQEASFDDAQIEAAVELNRQYKADKAISNSTPQLREKLNKDRQSCDEFMAHVEKAKAELDRKVEQFKRDVRNTQSQLDSASDTKRRCDQAELNNWKILGLPRVATLAHIFADAHSVTMKLGVRVSVHTADFVNGRLDADNYEFVRHDSQTQEDLDKLVTEARSHRKLPVDSAPATVIKDAIQQSSAPPTLRLPDGTIPDTMPEAQRNKSKWQVRSDNAQLAGAGNSANDQPKG